MRKAFTASTDVSSDELFSIVADLATYPQWLDLVAEVVPTDEPEAWLVTLRARIGPLARSKRLRMVRSVYEPAEQGGGIVRFERRETDGRDHAEWLLAADVTPADAVGTSTVAMELAYGGSLWSGLLDGMLDTAAERATEQLQAYAASTTP